MDVRRLLLVPVLLAVLAFSGPAAAQGYVVQPGDSLYTIAQRFGTTVDKLRAANNLWHTSEIWAGTWLRLPAGLSHTYTVQAGDSLYLIAQRLGTTVTQLRQANNLWGTDLILVGQVLAVPRSGAGSNPGGGSPPPGSGIHLSPSDLDLLARLVTAEAEGESYEGQVAVAATVLNRLRDPRCGTPAAPTASLASASRTSPAGPSSARWPTGRSTGRPPRRPGRRCWTRSKAGIPPTEPWAFTTRPRPATSGCASSPSPRPSA